MLTVCEYIMTSDVRMHNRTAAVPIAPVACTPHNNIRRIIINIITKRNRDHICCTTACVRYNCTTAYEWSAPTRLDYIRV